MSKLLQKIAKLLELAKRSTSDGERSAAMHQVLRLLAAHDLDLATAQEQIAADEYVAETVRPERSRRLPPEARACCSILAEFFHVRPLVTKSDCGLTGLQLFGRKHHVEIAEYVFVFLQRTFRDKWKARARHQGHNKGHAAYVYGMGIAVHESLRRERRAMAQPGSGEQLIRIGRDLDQALCRRYPGVEQTGRAAYGSASGYVDGQDIRIRPGVRSSAAARIGSQGEPNG